MKQLKNSRLKCFLLVVLVGCLLPAMSQANTVAYWRFEAGPDGSAVPARPNIGIEDQAGYGNHLFAVDQDAAGHEFTSDVPLSEVDGQPNQFSIRNIGNQGGLETDPNVVSPSGANLRTWSPANFTIEVFFKIASDSGGFTTFIGRDGRDVVEHNGDLAPVYFQVVPENAVAFKFADVDGNWHEAQSPNEAVQRYDIDSDPDAEDGIWYYTVAVSDGQVLNLYLQDVTNDGPMELVGSADLTGSENPRMAAPHDDDAVATSSNWSVGRGMYNGNPGDRFRGFIDEVKMSHAALTSDQWLIPSFAISRQPQDYFIYEGDDALFEVAASSPSGDIAYQWYYSEDDVIDTDVDTALLAGESLLLADVSEIDEGYYYAEVTDLATDQVIYTRVANLEIRYGRVISEATISDEIFSAADWTLPEGVFYATTVNSEPNTVQGVEFAQWDEDHPFNLWGLWDPAANLTGDMNWDGETDDDKALAQIAGSYQWANHAMRFYATDLVHGNEYDVYLLFALGDEAESRSIRVCMFDEFAAEDTVAYVDLRGGEDVGQGNPAPMRVVSFTAEPNEHGEIFGEVLYSNEGQYEANGAVLSGAIIVGEGTISIVRQPRDHIVYPGENVTFNIEVIGIADPVFTWYETSRGLQVGTGDTLTINNVDVSDEKYYYCVVTSQAIPGLEAISREARLGVKRLRAHWTLDEADFDWDLYLDVSGEGNDMWEGSDGYELQFVDGVIGDGVIIDEYSGWAEAVEVFNPSTVTNQLTVSFWTNWYGTNNYWQTFVAKRNGTAWGMDDVHWVITADHNTPHLRLKHAGNEDVVVFDALTDDGQWQHIVCTFDGETGRMYIDGVLEVEADFSLGNAPNAMVTIGSLATGAEHANGEMDDIRIYNYAIDELDVAEMYYEVTGIRPCIAPPPGSADLTGDCTVGVDDLSILINDWLESGLYPEIPVPDNGDND